LASRERMEMGMQRGGMGDTGGGGVKLRMSKPISAGKGMYVKREKRIGNDRERK
jgi:hypothetical protein